MALDSMTYHTLYTLNIGGMVTFTCHQKNCILQGQKQSTDGLYTIAEHCTTVTDTCKRH